MSKLVSEVHAHFRMVFSITQPGTMRCLLSLLRSEFDMYMYSLPESSKIELIYGVSAIEIS